MSRHGARREVAYPMVATIRTAEQAADAAAAQLRRQVGRARMNAIQVRGYGTAEALAEGGALSKLGPKWAHLRGELERLGKHGVLAVAFCNARVTRDGRMAARR